MWMLVLETIVPVKDLILLYQGLQDAAIWELPPHS